MSILSSSTEPKPVPWLGGGGAVRQKVPGHIYGAEVAGSPPPRPKARLGHFLSANQAGRHPPPLRGGWWPACPSIPGTPPPGGLVNVGLFATDRSRLRVPRLVKTHPVQRRAAASSAGAFHARPGKAATGYEPAFPPQSPNSFDCCTIARPVFSPVYRKVFFYRNRGSIDVTRTCHAHRKLHAAFW